MNLNLVFNKLTFSTKRMRLLKIVFFVCYAIGSVNCERQPTGLQSAVFSVIDLKWLNQKISRPVKWLNRIPEPVEIIDSVGKYTACDYGGSIQCSLKKSELSREIFLVGLAFMVILIASTFLKISFLTPILTIVFLCVYFPVVMSRTYDVPFGCFMAVPPPIPTCFFDDVQVILNLFPRHLTWPSPLVRGERHPRLVSSAFGAPVAVHYIDKSSVFDCATIGFGDGGRELLFAVDYFVPSWRKSFTSVGFSTNFGFETYKNLNYFNGTVTHTHIYQQCALLYSFTAIPLILLAIAGLIFGLALLHVFIIFSRNMLYCFGSLGRGIIELYLSQP